MATVNPSAQEGRYFKFQPTNPKVKVNATTYISICYFILFCLR